jgi:uncharacterized protein YheU (UPF0270 family)
MTDNIVKIPYKKLSSEALQGLIEEFVTRDGTDYGETEASLEHKTEQIMRQLKSGKAVITYDENTQTCNIILKDELLR